MTPTDPKPPAKASRAFLLGIFDLPTNRLWLSEAARAFLGATASTLSLSGEQWRRQVHPEDYPGLVSRYQTLLLKREESADATFRLRDGEGNYRALTMHLSVRYDEESAPIQLIGQCSLPEISPASETVAARAALLEQVLACSIDGIVAFDRQLAYTLFNPTMERLSGVAKADVIGRPMVEAFPFLEEQGHLASARQALSGEQGKTRCLPYFRPDGRRCYNESFTYPLRNDDGEITGGVAVIRDVTEAKEREDRLKQTEYELGTILQNEAFGIMSGDFERILDANDALLRMFGYAREELVAGELNLRRITPEEYRSIDAAQFESMVNRGYVPAYEKEFLRKDGSRVPVLLGGTLLDGDPRRWVCYVIDLTKQKQAEAAALRAARDLARSNRELEEFAYIVSHDLKEPLRMIASFVSLLDRRCREGLSREARDYIEFAVEGAHRMSELIDDLLRYSRAVRSSEEPRLVDSAAAYRRALDRLKTRVTVTRAQITHGDLPNVFAHENELSMVFEELLGNALKFRSDATPEIELKAERRGPEWEFTLQDNGLGIPPEALERVFLIFQKLHPKDGFEGTGLGLALCRKIIQRFGGRIWAATNPTQGTTLHFTLPADFN